MARRNPKKVGFWVTRSWRLVHNLSTEPRNPKPRSPALNEPRNPNFDDVRNEVGADLHALRFDPPPSARG